MEEIKFKFYASLLDRYEGYINSSRIYNQYFGFSEDPKVSEEEFEQQQFQGLIDSINRVPMAWEDSEAADKGTAFNECVDCIIENRKSDKMQIISDKEGGIIEATYNKRTFHFPIQLCKEFAAYFKGAITQQYCEGVLSTKYGNVMLYGYIDELMPFFVADIKTTSKYSAFKFRNNWQHHTYLYCLNTSGILINEFEYRVTDFKSTWSETYVLNPETDTPALIEHCERLIEFLEHNKSLITNKKIFALDAQ